MPNPCNLSVYQSTISYFSFSHVYVISLIFAISNSESFSRVGGKFLKNLFSRGEQHFFDVLRTDMSLSLLIFHQVVARFENLSILSVSLFLSYLPFMSKLTIFLSSISLSVQLFE